MKKVWLLMIILSMSLLAISCDNCSDMEIMPVYDPDVILVTEIMNGTIQGKEFFIFSNGEIFETSIENRYFLSEENTTRLLELYDALCKDIIHISDNMISDYKKLELTVHENGKKMTYVSDSDRQIEEVEAVYEIVKNTIR